MPFAFDGVQLLNAAGGELAKGEATGVGQEDAGDADPEGAVEEAVERLDEGFVEADVGAEKEFLTAEQFVGNLFERRSEGVDFDLVQFGVQLQVGEDLWIDIDGGDPSIVARGAGDAGHPPAAANVHQV